MSNEISTDSGYGPSSIQSTLHGDYLIPLYQEVNSFLVHLFKPL